MNEPQLDHHHHRVNQIGSHPSPGTIGNSTGVVINRIAIESMTLPSRTIAIDGEIKMSRALAVINPHVMQGPADSIVPIEIRLLQKSASARESPRFSYS